MPLRSKKRAWRKADPETDVIAAAQPSLAQLSNQELFTIDTGTDARMTKKHKSNHVVVPPKVSSRTYGKIVSSTELKIVRRLEQGYDQSMATTAQLKAIISTEKNKIYDIWDNESTPNHEIEIKKVRKHRSSAVVPSTAPAVVLPHAGAAANPNNDDYRLLLKAAIVEEIDKNNRRCLVKPVPIPVEQLDYVPGGNLSRPPPEADDDEEEDVAEGGDARDSTNKKEKPRVKKTKAQRNREKRVFELNQKLAAQRQLKKKRAAIEEVKHLGKQIVVEEKLSQQRQAERVAHEDAKSKLPKRLGKLKYEPLPLTVALSEDLTPHLRATKLEGNLFRDRFKSLQARNIIEPRAVQKTRRRYHQKLWIRK